MNRMYQVVKEHTNLKTGETKILSIKVFSKLRDAEAYAQEIEYMLFDEGYRCLRGANEDVFLVNEDETDKIEVKIYEPQI